MTVGKHLLVDFHGCMLPVRAEELRDRLANAALAAGATVLGSHFHDFADDLSETHGATAFVMLAESHISAHTWPEHGLAAIDIFMCGKAQAETALDHLRLSFAPQSEHVTTHLRGAASSAR